jgi:hypothetical protein
MNPFNKRERFCDGPRHTIFNRPDSFKIDRNTRFQEVTPNNLAIVSARYTLVVVQFVFPTGSRETIYSTYTV